MNRFHRSPGARCRAWLASFTLVGAAALAGCAGAPRALDTPPTAPSATWQGAPGVPAAATPARWWQGLADPTLDALMTRALAEAPDLQTARTRLQEARARRRATEAAAGPSVTGSASVSRSRSSAASGSGATRSLFDLGLDASWEADLFGRVRAGLDAAQADEAASLATLGEAQRSLQAEVALAWLDWQGARARLAIARDGLSRQTETRQIAGWRAQAGLAATLDVEQATASAEQTRASADALAGALAQAQLALELLLGQTAGGLDALLAPARAQAPVLPAWPWPQGLALPADVLRERPDVRAAAATWQAERAREAQAQAALRPQLTLSGSIGLQALTLGTLKDGGNASLAAALLAPLFDGGRLRAQLDAQTAVRERAALAYRSTVLTALTEVEQALASAAAQREQAQALAAAAQAARNAALLARQRYDSGLVDFRTVLDAERSALTLDDSVAAQQLESLKTVVRLYKALGGPQHPAG